MGQRIKNVLGFGKTAPSMRSRLFCIVVLCWIIPVVTITVVLSYVITSNITKQTKKNAADAVYAAAEICMEKIDGAVSSSRYASYNSSIADAYSSFRRSRDYIQLYQSIDTFLVGNYKFDNDFMFTYLRFYGDENIPLGGSEFYTFNEALFPESKSETGRSAYNKFISADADTIIADAEDKGTGIYFMNIDGKLYMLRNLYIQGSRPTAVLVMRLNTQNWFETLFNTPWSKDVMLTLGGQNLVVRGSEINITGLDISTVSKDIGTAHTLKQDNSLLLYGEIKADDYLFDFFVSADESTLYDQSRFLQMVLLLASLAAVPLLVIVLIYVYNNVNQPVNQLAKGAEEINKGHFGYQLDYKAKSSEFIQLTSSFNKMSTQLQAQFEQIFREELALRDAKIMALQLQINPHFLGNTLEIINWEARLGNNVNVTKMIEALSTMLDAALDRNKKPMVHLSQELMYVEAYLYIVNERFGKRLSVTRNIDDSLLAFDVPRLILQPLVENAIEHGITPLQHGSIQLSIYTKGDRLYIDIENDGSMTSEDKSRIEKLLDDNSSDESLGSTHLGIRNVYERIKIIYGQSSSFTISTTDKDTVITRIVLPYSS